MGQIEIPPWVWPLVIGAVLGFAANVLISVARARAKALRGDKDPTNDWQADVWDGIADAAEKRDGARLMALVQGAKKK